VIFVKNLALMLDALEELSDHSLGLQTGDITFMIADRLIARQIEVFRSRKDKPGVFYTEATHAITAGTFCGIQLAASNKEIEINCKQFYQALVDSMTARLMSETDKKFRDVVSFFEKEQYQGMFAADHGEDQLRALCKIFNFPFSDMKQAFRDYKDSKGDNITNTFQKLINAVDTVPVSTAACERGFSQMNEICTSLRSQITVAHISSLMFINIVGPPLTMWNPLPCVKAWHAKNRRDATSSHGMSRKSPVHRPDDGMANVWNIFAQ
jgi:hypothetical protein